jgi:hypothetical protein
MASNRTFQFWGQGYGSETATITARVNSTQVYSGPVPTVDQPITPIPQPLPSAQVILFTIPDSALLNTDFSGSLPMVVQVTGGTGVLFGLIDSNYYVGNVELDPNAGTVDHFAQCYSGEPTNSEGTPDPRSSVQIDGVTQVPPLVPSLGCWTRIIPTGSTLTYNWNIGLGQAGNVVGNTSNYTPPA